MKGQQWQGRGGQRVEEDVTHEELVLVWLDGRRRLMRGEVDGVGNVILRGDGEKRVEVVLA
jgi:hypothetical protein